MGQAAQLVLRISPTVFLVLNRNAHNAA